VRRRRRGGVGRQGGGKTAGSEQSGKRTHGGPLHDGAGERGGLVIIAQACAGARASPTILAELGLWSKPAPQEH
jgi:hypothetical protein